MNFKIRETMHGREVALYVVVAANGGLRLPWGTYTKESEAYEKALNLLEELGNASFPEVSVNWVSEAMWNHKWAKKFGPLP